MFTFFRLRLGEERGDKRDKSDQLESESKLLFNDRHPFDVSDCEFEDESNGDYPEGESQVADGFNQNVDTCSDPCQPCPLDESRSLFSTLNQSVSLAVQSKYKSNKCSVCKKSNLA